MMFFSLLLCNLLVPSPAFADGDSKKSDHQIAMEALSNGEVIPIMEILTLSQKYLPGEVIEVELESDDGELYCEIEVLTSAGLVRELSIPQLV
ncbi:MAG: hypothetical protein RH945_05470 [Hyphomonas sp.]